jgi:hypothetical protein
MQPVGHPGQARLNKAGAVYVLWAVVRGCIVEMTSFDPSHSLLPVRVRLCCEVDLSSWASVADTAELLTGALPDLDPNLLAAWACWYAYVD